MGHRLFEVPGLGFSKDLSTRWRAELLAAHKPQRIVEPLRIGITFESHLNFFIFSCTPPPHYFRAERSITSMRISRLPKRFVHRINFFYTTDLQYTILHFRTTAVIYPGHHDSYACLDVRWIPTAVHYGYPAPRNSCAVKNSIIHRRMRIPNFKK